MKILYAPFNIASMPSVTAEAMNKLPGVKAICISIGENKYSTYFNNTVTITINSSNILYKIISKIKILLILFRYILWADVIHWTWRGVLPYNIDLQLIKLFKKKAFIEWVGSDIRVPEVLMYYNETYKHAFYNGYEYANGENKLNSYKTQQIFSKYNFTPILVPEMKLYLKPHLFSIVYDTQYRIFTSLINPQFPSKDNTLIKIIHSPSARIAKGSNYIEATINKLKLKYNIEYIELHNLPHIEVLSKIQFADIFIDQIVLGSYAMAAIEAMCYGKPVIAYILPVLFEKGINNECPIINATHLTLEIELEKLICNPELRHSLGRESRKYVEKFHDADILSKSLYDIYSKEFIKN
jgi:glycosyltransferase involved in cell wall biosynthesis